MTPRIALETEYRKRGNQMDKITMKRDGYRWVMDTQYGTIDKMRPDGTFVGRRIYIGQTFFQGRADIPEMIMRPALQWLGAYLANGNRNPFLRPVDPPSEVDQKKMADVVDMATQMMGNTSENTPGEVFAPNGAGGTR